MDYIGIYIKVNNVIFKLMHVRFLDKRQIFYYAYSNINIQLNTAVLVPHAQKPNRAMQWEPDGKDALYELEVHSVDNRWRNMISSI